MQMLCGQYNPSRVHNKTQNVHMLTTYKISIHIHDMDPKKVLK